MPSSGLAPSDRLHLTLIFTLCRLLRKCDSKPGDMRRASLQPPLIPLCSHFLFAASSTPITFLSSWSSMCCLYSLSDSSRTFLSGSLNACPPSCHPAGLCASLQQPELIALACAVPPPCLKCLLLVNCRFLRLVLFFIGLDVNSSLKRRV